MRPGAVARTEPASGPAHPPRHRRGSPGWLPVRRRSVRWSRRGSRRWPRVAHDRRSATASRRLPAVLAPMTIPYAHRRLAVCQRHPARIRSSVRNGTRLFRRGRRAGGLRGPERRRPGSGRRGEHRGAPGGGGSLPRPGSGCDRRRRCSAGPTPPRRRGRRAHPGSSRSARTPACERPCSPRTRRAHPGRRDPSRRSRSAVAHVHRPGARLEPSADRAAEDLVVRVLSGSAQHRLQPALRPPRHRHRAGSPGLPARPGCPHCAPR